MVLPSVAREYHPKVLEVLDHLQCRLIAAYTAFVPAETYFLGLFSDNCHSCLVARSSKLN